MIDLDVISLGVFFFFFPVQLTLLAHTEIDAPANLQSSIFSCLNSQSAFNKQQELMEGVPSDFERGEGGCWVSRWAAGLSDHNNVQGLQKLILKKNMKISICIGENTLLMKVRGQGEQTGWRPSGGNRNSNNRCLQPKPAE